jgi:hypothetical protein
MTLRPPFGTLGMLIAVAAAVASVFTLLPEIVEASEANAQYHHLAHAVEFLMGIALGMAMFSTPALFERFAPRWSSIGLAAVILIPAGMLLLMIPSVYESLESNESAHALYHGGLICLGLITGMGAALQGRVVGRILLVLSVGMMLMYAAGVSGG